MAAGNAVIGSLRVDLGINSANFATGVKKAQSSLGALSSTFKAFAAGAAAAFSFGAISNAITSIIDKADELGKTAQKIGIPVEELSKLEYAAKLADVSLEQLSTGIGKLSKNMAAIQSGQGARAGDAMAAIGVSATDASGRLRSTSDVMGDIAEKFAGMRDGAGKTALAMEIFGRSGAQMIPLLNAGRKGLADAATEAEKFGIVIGGNTAKAAEAFNDNLTRIKTAGEGLINKAIVPLLPKIVELTDRFVAFVKDGSGIHNFFTKLSEYVATTAKEAQSLGIIMSVMMENFTKGDGMTAALERWKAGFAEIEKLKQRAGGISASPSTISSMLDSINNFGGNKTTQTDAPVIKSLSEDTKKLSEEFLQSQYNAKQLNDGVLALSRTMPEAGEAAQSLGSALADTLGSTLQDWFDQAIEGTFRFKDALKDLLGQLARVATNNLITSLFTSASHPVQGGGLLGGIGKLFGFAKGGSFQVGGSGGIDSQLVAFKASPNEQVSVTKPGQEQGGSTVIANFYGSNNDATGMAMLRADFQEFQQKFSGNVINVVRGEKALQPKFGT